MSADLRIPTAELLTGLREMWRQWRQNGSRLDSTGRASPSNTNTIAPIVQAIEVTSSTADAYGYPARIQTYNGSTWSDTYAECRAVQIGSTIAGAVLATGFYPLGRLMTVAGGYHVYGVTRSLKVDENFTGTVFAHPCHTISFPPDVIVSYSDGHVSIPFSDQNNGGLVSRVAQNYVGLKDFMDGLRAEYLDFSPSGLAGYAHFGSRIIGQGGMYFGVGSGGDSYALEIDANNGRLMLHHLDSAGSPDSGYCAYAIRNGGVNYLGATGTLSPGAASVGGIITSAGSGSFFDGDAANLTGTLDGGTF